MTVRFRVHWFRSAVQRWRCAGEEGFSLLEVLLALALTSVVVVTVDGSVSALQQNQLRVQTEVQQIDSAQTATEFMSKALHGLSALTYAPTLSSAVKSAVGSSYTCATSTPCIQFSTTADPAGSATVTIAFISSGGAASGEGQLVVESASGSTTRTESRIPTVSTAAGSAPAITFYCKSSSTNAQTAMSVTSSATAAKVDQVTVSFAVVAQGATIPLSVTALAYNIAWSSATTC